MTIKTFDPNRVGGGTFQLEQDATGAYTIKEVGFVKLPDLKLPEINQAAYTTPPDSDDDDDTTPDPCPPGFKLVNGVCQRIQDSSGGGGGGGQSQNFDYTGATQLTNIQDEATKFAKQDTGIDRTDINQGAIRMETLPSSNIQFAQEAYNQAKSNYDNLSGKFKTTQGGTAADLENLKKSEDLMKQASDVIDDYKMQYATSFPSTIKAAPKIADFSEGPKTVPFGTLTGAKVEDIGTPLKESTFNAETFDDAVGTKIKPEATKPSVMENVKKLLDPKNSLPVKILSGVGTALKTFEDALLGPQQVALNTSNKNALDSLGYKTNFELGNSTDPGRIKSAIMADGSVTTSAIDNVFIGMNRTSATGNVMSGARKRVATVQKTIDKAIAKGDTAKAARFQERKDRYDKQIQDAQAKKSDVVTGADTSPGATGGEGGNDACFIKGTLITMFDGSKKPVEQVDLGDKVAEGGNVFAAGKFLNTELYDYKGIKVSGSHMVNEDGTWMRVRDTKHGKSLGDNLNTVYVFGSENRRILINDILFTDYFEVSEQDKLIEDSEDFFNNWKSYGNTINEHNVNTLNAS